MRFRDGIVTSASIAGRGGSLRAGWKSRGAPPGLGLGVHLNLSNRGAGADRVSVMSPVENGTRESSPAGPGALLLRHAAAGAGAERSGIEWDAQIRKCATRELSRPASR